MRIRDEFRALFPALAVALLFPVPLMNFLADGAGRAFAFIYLYFGCAVLAAECFRPDPDGPGRWPTRMAALAAAAAAAVTNFCVFYWAIGGYMDAGVISLAILSAAFAVCIVPYLTMLDGRPYVAVVASALLLACVKFAGGAVVRVAYGPTAAADGQMSMSWREPNFLVWFCLSGALLLSAVGLVLGYRRAGLPPGKIRPEVQSIPD